MSNTAEFFALPSVSNEHGWLQSNPDLGPFIANRACPNKTPEEHLLGEFPMSCYPCHIYTDS